MKPTFKLNGNTLTVENSLFSFDFPYIASATSANITPNSRSAPYTEICAKRQNGSEVAYQMWEDLPVIRVTDDSEFCLFKLHGDHWMIKRINLNAFTDEVDTLTAVNDYTLIERGLQLKLPGDIFFFEDPVTEEAYVLSS
jgi:hypothetical protein